MSDIARKFTSVPNYLQISKTDALYIFPNKRNKICAVYIYASFISTMFSLSPLAVRSMWGLRPLRDQFPGIYP